MSSVLRRSPKSIDDWQVDWIWLALSPFENPASASLKLCKLHTSQIRHSWCQQSAHNLYHHCQPQASMSIVTWNGCGDGTVRGASFTIFMSSAVSRQRCSSCRGTTNCFQLFSFRSISCRLVSHDWSSHYSSDAMLKDFVQRHGLELSSRSAARNPTPGSRGCGMFGSCLKSIKKDDMHICSTHIGYLCKGYAT